MGLPFCLSVSGWDYRSRFWYEICMIVEKLLSIVLRDWITYEVCLEQVYLVPVEMNLDSLSLISCSRLIVAREKIVTAGRLF